MTLTAETKEAVLKALRADVGQAYDNLYRARHAFASLTPEVMGQKYGQSDSTRQEIIDGYREWHEKAVSVLEEATKSL